MFIKSPTETESLLDARITSALKKLDHLEPVSEEYGTIVKHLSELHKLKIEERSKPLVNPDTVLVVAANLFGILWLARYEREHVIKAPKAFGQIIKPR